MESIQNDAECEGIRLCNQICFPLYACAKEVIRQYADKLSIVCDDIHMARSTQNTIREFIRKHPTVYCSTHTPLGYENLEAKRVIDLDNPPKTIWPTEDYFVTEEGTGKYICSVCGYVYDPAEHDGVAFEDLPEDWRCPRCRQPKEKFNKA